MQPPPRGNMHANATSAGANTWHTGGAGKHWQRCRHHPAHARSMQPWPHSPSHNPHRRCAANSCTTAATHTRSAACTSAQHAVQASWRSAYTTAAAGHLYITAQENSQPTVKVNNHTAPNYFRPTEVYTAELQVKQTTTLCTSYVKLMRKYGHASSCRCALKVMLERCSTAPTGCNQHSMWQRRPVVFHHGCTMHHKCMQICCTAHVYVA